MAIGLVNLFPTRPYFHHLIYFRHLLEDSGYFTSTFYCLGGNLSCYYKKQHASIPNSLICLQCKFRRQLSLDKRYSVHKYNHSTSSVNIDVPDEILGKLEKICINSFATIHRIEQLTDINKFYSISELEKDLTALKNVFVDAMRWIEESNVDKVVLFNGRMDILAAIALACEYLKIPFISYEASFFGNGLYLYFNTNCLSLAAWERGCSEFIDKPLTSAQAAKAAEILRKRLSRAPSLEWRDYFSDSAATEVDAVDNVKSKVLILLSSTNEVYGSQSYSTMWENYLIGVDKIIEEIGADPREVIVRGHPVWNTKICGIGGEQIEEIYKSWAVARNYKYIPSKIPIDTQLLIKKTDFVIINFSSALFEAAYMDKCIISTHSGYCDNTNFCLKVDSPEKLSLIRPHIDDYYRAERITDRYRHLLRFTYLAAYRLPVFFNEMRPKNRLEWEYNTENTRILETIFQALEDRVYPYSDNSYEQTSEDNELLEILKIMDHEKISPSESLTLQSPFPHFAPIRNFVNSRRKRSILYLESFLGKGDYFDI